MKIKKYAGRKRIRDRGINWQQKYRERSLPLKKKFEKELGRNGYWRWEGHDYTTNSNYFVVVAPSLTKERKKRFFAGIKKLPHDKKHKVYAPYGEYFNTMKTALSHVTEKWGVPFPRDAVDYSLADLAPIDIPRHMKA